MGVKTQIDLDGLNGIFTNHHFTKLLPTKNGIMDTTYIVYEGKNSYILKHYERDDVKKVDLDTDVLKMLKGGGLNVPTLLESKDGWYIYERLRGAMPKQTQLYHIKVLADFLSQMHNATSQKSIGVDFVKKNEIEMMLNVLKRNNFYKYKKFEPLRYMQTTKDGIIHGDIFKDNTVFDANKLGVFDFSDSGDGNFAFDAGITLFGFDVKQRFFMKMFLDVYNQKAVKKLKLEELVYSVELAERFYGLKRSYRYLKGKEI